MVSTKLFFLLLVLYITLFFKMGDMAFVGTDEPRYALVAEEMWRNGNYIVPTLHGKPWLEKPPLYYWMAAASYSLFGVSETSARLPSALAGVFSTLALWWVARTLWSEEVAFFAALMAATSPLFFVYSRAASTDSLFSSLFNIGMLLYLYGLQQNLFWPYLVSGAAVGLAALAKGPLALILTVFSAVLSLGFFFSPRRLVGTLLAAVACAITALPWYWKIIERTGFDFISVFFLNHNLARFFTAIHHHEHSFYYYFGILAVGMYPWPLAALLGVAGLRQIRERDMNHRSPLVRSFSSISRTWTFDLRTVFIVAWILMPLLFFSASRAKLPAYILPLVAPLSLAVSLVLSRVEEDEFRRHRNVLFGLLIITSLLLMVAGALLSKATYHAAWLGTSVGVLLVLGGVLAFLFALRGLPAALLALAGANVVIAAFMTIAVLPVAENFHSARYSVQHALPQLPAGESFYQYRYFHHTVDYYGGGRTVMEPIDGLSALRRILLSHSPLWAITDVAELSELTKQSDLQVDIVAAKGNVAAVRISRRAL